VNTTNAERGRAVRRALLAVARLSLEQRVLFPKYCTLASAMGCDGSNIARHLAMLQAEDAVSFVSAGRRLYVVAVRS
jgi:hypothetical protein